jgi:Asp-tRNA(Asn)/Glu-tRNA(Gln) amidotransferase A subunit family amidase
MYLSGQATPTDVARALLPLIRRDISPQGKHSTAWIDTKVELVLKAAEESTIRYRQNRSLGPLDGVPASIKDDFDLDGYDMTMGSNMNYAGRAVKSGSTTNWSVRKLQEAGVIILGKLTMHEFGMGEYTAFSLHTAISILTFGKILPVTIPIMVHHSTPSTRGIMLAEAHRELVMQLVLA